MTGPQQRLRTINIVGSGTPKTPVSQYRERDRGSTTAIGPQMKGRGITASPPTVGCRWTREGWARETVSSGRVSGAVAHLSKSRRAARRRDAIADRMLGMGDHRPAVERGRMMAVGTFHVCSNAAVNSDLSCFLYTL